MTAFRLYAGLLFAAALPFTLVSELHRPRRRVDAKRTRLNVSLYRERLGELETQHDAGTLHTVQLEAGRVEASRELLDDAHARHAAQNVEEATTRVEALLASRPESSEAWSLLGRAYLGAPL